MPEPNPNSPKEVLRAASLGFAVAVALVAVPMLLEVNLWWVITPLAVITTAIRIANWRRRSVHPNAS